MIDFTWLKKKICNFFQNFNKIQRLYICIKYILVISVQMFEEKLF